MKKTFIFLLLICITFGCKDNEDGKWDDNIKLSQKEFQFNASENTAVITTQADGWWLNSIFFKDGQNFDFTDTNTTAKEFIITKPQFVLERKNGKEITVKLLKNTTGSERTFVIGLQLGNYFDGVSITQAGK